MKKISSIVIFTFILSISCSLAQTSTGKITGLKDPWGEAITYIGEIKNKQPNGLGVATYSNGHALRYAGNFLNGLYNGKGAMVFSDGSFLSGEWKNGKLNGKGANLTKNGNFYSGYFADGKKEGKGYLLYQDNSILMGEWKGDKFNGRSVYIPASAGTFNDNIYVEDKKNGAGYQYEIDGKKLFQGKWKDGTWDGATTDNYASFLNIPDFYAEKTETQVLMGKLNKGGSQITDTAFYYDLKNKKRYFGRFTEGKFETGAIVRDDSSRFIGNLTTSGANGTACIYKVGAFFDDGTYVDDYLNGPNCLSIDLKNKTIYYGETRDKGFFSGKAWFANNRNEFYNGDYLKGKFTGKGYKINSAGYCTRGVFEDGYPITITSITNDNGQPVSLLPKTLTEAITLVAKDATETDLDLLMGKIADEEGEDLSYVTKNKAVLSFPAALKQDFIQEDENFKLNYIAPYLKTTDLTKAKIKYEELCKQLAAVQITIYKAEGPFALEKKLSESTQAEALNSCTFLFPAKKGIIPGYAASVLMVKDKSGNYTVEIVLGDKDSSLLTGEE